MLDGVRTWLPEFAYRKRLVLFLALIAIGSTHSAPMGWNDMSRMATIQSLVESGSFIIDKSDFIGTGDKVFINGHFYSDKPPFPAVLGAAIYYPLYHLGFRLHEGHGISYFGVTLLSVKLLWLLGILAFFYSLQFTGLDAGRRRLASVALGLGSTYFSWSTAFNNHELAASFLSIGFCFLLKARFEARTRRDLAVAGFFLALAATADIPTSIFYVVFFLYLVRDPKLRKNCGFYLLPLSLTVLPALAMTYSIHHSVLPVQIFRSYFEYYGSPWIGSSELSGMGTNDAPFFVRYALLTLFGPKGFLIYNPFLAVALWGLAREIRKKEAFYHEGIAVAGASIALALYYWLTTNNYGGSSYSIRWFVPLIPVLLFFLYPFLEDFNGRRAMQFRALLGVSILIAFVGAINPWSQVIYSEAPFIANIKQVAQRLHGPSTTSSVP